MLSRNASIFIIFALCIGSFPLGKTTNAQDHGVILEQPPDDGNPNTREFSGGYWSGGQFVSVAAYSVRSDSYYVPTADGGWEEQVDYLYSDGNQTKSDGTNLAYAVDELDRSSDYNFLRITLGGSTIVIDLQAQQGLPVSDADQEALNAWAASTDAATTRDTSIALLDSYDPANPEPWLPHLGVVLLLAPSSQGTAKIRKSRANEVTFASIVCRLTSDYAPNAPNTPNRMTSFASAAVPLSRVARPQ